MNSHTTADDNASMVTTSSFASTIAVLKSKIPLGKEHKARKEEKSEKKSQRKSLPKDSKTPAQRTAEHYQIYASMR